MFFILNFTSVYFSFLVFIESKINGCNSNFPKRQRNDFFKKLGNVILQKLKIFIKQEASNE